jgi:Fe-Mn family superoxide dismutase
MQTTRRDFCKATLITFVSASAFARSAFAQIITPKKEATMPFTLPPLPYAPSALEPHMSEKTFSFHYNKHHQAYITKTNELIAGTPLENKTLEEIIMESAKDKGPLFNNSAQVWNHTFFWNSMKPNGGGTPTGKIAEKINADFGSFDEFKKQFKEAGIGQFGSGWAWLVLDGGKLKVTKTPNADLPMAHGQKAILTCDVWEHAYYLDYQNRRPDFLTAFLDHLANWEFAEKNLG